MIVRVCSVFFLVNFVSLLVLSRSSSSSSSCYCSHPCCCYFLLLLPFIRSLSSHVVSCCSPFCVAPVVFITWPSCSRYRWSFVFLMSCSLFSYVDACSSSSSSFSSSPLCPSAYSYVSRCSLLLSPLFIFLLILSSVIAHYYDSSHSC